MFSAKWEKRGKEKEKGKKQKKKEKKGKKKQRDSKDRKREGKEEKGLSYSMMEFVSQIITIIQSDQGSLKVHKIEWIYHAGGYQELMACKVCVIWTQIACAVEPQRKESKNVPNDDKSWYKEQMYRCFASDQNIKGVHKLLL